MKTVEPILTELQALLREEMSLHAGLRDELRLECDEDGKLNSTEFIGLQQRKYNLVARIENLETKRMSKVSELAQQWEEPMESLTLGKIIDRSEETHGKPLKSCFDGLLALVEEIRELSRESGANANARLKAVESTLSVISDAARVHPTYSGKGKIQQRPPTFKATSA